MIKYVSWQVRNFGYLPINQNMASLATAGAL